jgi:hypothetical protein
VLAANNRPFRENRSFSRSFISADCGRSQPRPTARPYLYATTTPIHRSYQYSDTGQFLPLPAIYLYTNCTAVLYD